jgi:predicted nucleic acid-binding protein
LIDLDRLPADVDVPTASAVVFKTTQALCRKHGLTAYDAAYLELAVRQDCPLAAVDEDLKRAAVEEGVRVL